MLPLQQTQLAARFECLGDACEDTCCRNWSMQVDDATLTRYREKAPELLAAVDTQSDGLPVMKRDETTRYCVKMEDGLCGIHKKYGSSMLGDACHFYPRVTRQLGGEIMMTLTPSCPETVRLMLSLNEPFALAAAQVERLPSIIKNYLPETQSAENALLVHQAFIAAAMDENAAPEQSLARIASVVRSMMLLDPATWHQSVPLYLKLADGRIPKAEEHPTDPFNLLHMLCGLIVASRKPASERLRQTIGDMEQALGATLDWQNVQISLNEDSAQKFSALRASWLESQTYYANALRRFLAMQLSLGLFPFAGLGDDFTQRITFIGVRFAVVKLALACAHHLHGELSESDVVRIIQSLSRLLDHLGDAKFSLMIFEETGWLKEPRLLGLCA